MKGKCRLNRPRRGFSRLAPVIRAATYPLALGLGLAAALALASCGGGEDAKLLPGKTAAEINENLALVRRLAAEGECVDAEDAALQVSTQIEQLSGIDAKLKQALEQGAARLNEVVLSCAEETTASEEETETSTAPETTEAEPEQEKKKEKEEEKLEKEEQKQQEQEEKEAEQEEKEAEGPPFGEAKGHDEHGPPAAPPAPPSGGIGPGGPAGGGGD